MAFSKENTILGLGKIQLDGIDIGYTRGGGQFTVNRTFHDIVADGDRGTHKNAVIIDEERATLQASFIELISDNMVKLFPALAATTAEGKKTVKPTFNVLLADYHEVVWIGKTKGGKAVKITLHDAISKDNIDWSLEEKNEVVQSVTFEACYEELTDIFAYEAPYEIEYANQSREPFPCSFIGQEAK